MIWFMMVLVGLLCAGLTVAKKDEFMTDYCAPQNTAAVNGIFSVLIFLRHASQYVTLNGVMDQPYLVLDSFFGQMVVVTYLFFSGYGIMCSIQKKGTAYVKAMPFHRLFKLWYHFAIIMVMFVITGLITDRTMELKTVLLSFIGYTSLGNSNWYMFVTFAMYIIITISFLMFQKNRWVGAICTLLLTFAFMYGEYKIGLPGRFYNTLICFPVGMIFALCKPYVDRLMMKSDVIWFVVFGTVTTLLLYCSQNRWEGLNYYFFNLLGMIVILLLMMKIKIQSSVLDWFGQHIFSFFMLQRIPMILLQYLGVNNDPYIFICLSFVVTVVLAVLFDKAMEITDGWIFKKKAPKQPIMAEK